MIPVKDFLSSAFNDFFQPATEPLLDAKEVSCRAWRATVLCPLTFCVFVASLLTTMILTCTFEHGPVLLNLPCPFVRNASANLARTTLDVTLPSGLALRSQRGCTAVAIWSIGVSGSPSNTGSCLAPNLQEQVIGRRKFDGAPGRR
jgi:hypothetical protein